MRRFVIRLLSLGALMAPVAGRAETSAEAWAKQVAADMESRVVLGSRGAAPPAALPAPMRTGEVLLADITMTSTTKVWSDGREPLLRTSTVEATLRIVLAEKHGDDFPATFELTKLEGTLANIATLARKGSFQPGVYGEPWSLIVVPAAQTIEERLWAHDLTGWVRRVLVPLPIVPVGKGASWSIRWEDYFGYESVIEDHVYRLDALTRDKRARIFATVNKQSNAASKSTMTAEIELPLGARTVPSAKWTAEGRGDVVEHGVVTHLETRTVLRLRPHTVAR